MSEYLKQLKIQVLSRVSGVKFQDVSPVEIVLLKEGYPEIRVRDEKDYVTVRYGDQTIRYDKWYTKPEHLAEMIKVYYAAQKK
ncbi:MAG: hypothetical protein LM554_02490 [Desulfurococcaceae archaeon]|jgi:hypothetical protein|nr:hypothetical protein [Desulfurococcaceae archaeon]